MSDAGGDPETRVTRAPVLECIHKNITTCHYSYVTKFKSHREQVCSETYNKHCTITFTKKPEVETFKKCYRPLVSVCENRNSDEDIVCQTFQAEWFMGSISTFHN